MAGPDTALLLSGSMGWRAGAESLLGGGSQEMEASNAKTDVAAAA